MEINIIEYEKNNQILTGTLSLQELEKIIETGVQGFYQAGMAFKKIKENRKTLLPANQTFEKYCVERWGLNKSQVYRLLEAAEVVDNLSPIGEVSSTTYPQPTKSTMCRICKKQQQAIIGTEIA